MVTTRQSSKLTQTTLDAQLESTTDTSQGKTPYQDNRDGNNEKHVERGTKRELKELSEKPPHHEQEESHVDKKIKMDETSEPIQQSKVQEKAEERILKRDDILEYGRIFFLYKPKVSFMDRPFVCLAISFINFEFFFLDSLPHWNEQVETPHPQSTDDIQRLHIILQPHSTANSKDPSLSRLLIIGRKTFPTEKSRPFWGFVTEVSKDVGDLHKSLGEVRAQSK